MTGLRAALRVGLRRTVWVVVALATYVAVRAVLPMMVLSAPPAAAVSAVDRLAVAHGCRVVPGPGRPMLLIASAAGGARLVLAATTTDGARAQTDLFDEERADFYGWCER